MDAKLLADWVAALRSGEYQQTTAMLYSPLVNAYCCLGVLCKVAGAEFTDFTDGETSEDGKPYTWFNRPVLDGKMLTDDSDESLSHYALNLFYLDSKAEAELIDMNDSQGKTFNEIADYIEANVK